MYMPGPLLPAQQPGCLSIAELPPQRQGRYSVSAMTGHIVHRNLLFFRTALFNLFSYRLSCMCIRRTPAFPKVSPPNWSATFFCHSLNLLLFILLRKPSVLRKFLGETILFPDATGQYRKKR